MSSNVNNPREVPLNIPANGSSANGGAGLSESFKQLLGALPPETRELFQNFQTTLDNLQTALTERVGAPKGCGCVACGGGCACGCAGG